MPGWPWDERAMSSAEPPNSMAMTASWITSPAWAPTMWTPSTRSVPASARIFTKPSVSALQRARELAVKGNLPTLYWTPVSFSCSSVLPRLATSGHV